MNSEPMDPMDQHPDPKDLTVEYVADRITMSIEDWPGNCFAVVCAILRENIVDGKPRYGHYYGPVSDQSIFADKSVISHAWIVTGRSESGLMVVDPTRWVFTAPKRPRVYVGPDTVEYDEGGQAMRELTRQQTGPPSGQPSREEHELSDLSRRARARAQEICRTERPSLTTRQMHWLANASLNRLGVDAKEIYEFVIEEGHRSFIPIDHKAVIFGIDHEEMANSAYAAATLPGS